MYLIFHKATIQPIYRRLRNPTPPPLTYYSENKPEAHNCQNISGKQREIETEVYSKSTQKLGVVEVHFSNPPFGPLLVGLRTVRFLILTFIAFWGDIDQDGATTKVLLCGAFESPPVAIKHNLVCSPQSSFIRHVVSCFFHPEPTKPFFHCVLVVSRFPGISLSCSSSRVFWTS